MNRRKACYMILVTGGGFIITSCDSPSPAAPSPGPSPNTIDLLTRIRQNGRNAQRVAFGTNGAAQIAIDGSINWNFFVNDQPVAIGPVTLPNIDVAALQIPSDARVEVRGF